MNTEYNMPLVQLQYDECLKEYQISLLNIEKCMSKAKDIMLDLSRVSTPDKKYSSVSANLGQIRNVFRQVNYELGKYLTPSLDPSAPIFQPNQLKKCNGSSNNSVSVNPLFNETNVYDDPPHIHFKFIQANLNMYAEDHQGKCIITHIKNNDEGKFFIIDCNLNSNKLDFRSFLKSNPEKLDVEPSEKVVFGIVLEGFIFRAVKQRSKLTNRSNNQVFIIYLIDVGEVLEINLNQYQLYALSKKEQEIPAQCIYCILDEKTGTYLKNSNIQLYTQHRFRVTKVKKHSLHVILLPLQENPPKILTTNPFLEVVDFNHETNHQLNIVNPFENLFCFDSDNFNVPNSTYDPDDQHSDKVETKFLHYKYLHKKALNDIIKLNLNNNNNDKSIDDNYNLLHEKDINYVDVTEEERKILFEEEKTTTNPLEAVMGYIPRDEERICKFYDPSINGCFKGANCKLEHIKPVEGGWSREKLPTDIGINASIVLPEIGKQIIIMPTHIVNVEEFYGQILTSPNKQCEVDLLDLNCKLNADEYKMRFKKFDRLPVLNELVFALYIDNLWYRAQVSNIYDDNTIKVFYVDYGNCRTVNLDDIRKWSYNFEYLAFQAIKCQLDNVTKLKPNHIEANEFFKRKILNVPLSAKVTNNKIGLTLLLKDPDGFDLGEQLVKKNFAKSKTPCKFVPNSHNTPA